MKCHSVIFAKLFMQINWQTAYAYVSQEQLPVQYYLHLNDRPKHVYWQITDLLKMHGIVCFWGLTKKLNQITQFT